MRRSKWLIVTVCDTVDGVRRSWRPCDGAGARRALHQSPRGTRRDAPLARREIERRREWCPPAMVLRAGPRRGRSALPFACRVDETSSRDEAGDREIAELAALADGSLAPERRAALEARVAASPELADRLAEQQRAVALTRSAAEEVEAPAALRARIEAQRRARRARAPRRLVLVGAARGRRAGRRRGDRARRARLGHLRRALPRCPCTDRPGARRQRRGDAHQDLLGLADRARRHRASPPRRRAASTRRGCGTPPACSCRSGRSTKAGRSRSGRACRRRTSPTLTVTRERADGDQASSGEKVLVGTVDTAADRAAGSRAALDSAHDLLAGAVEAAHHRALADAQRARRLLVREAGDVDGDEDVAEVIRKRGDRGVELAGFERGLRLARVRVGDEVELVGQRRRDGAGGSRSASGSGRCCAAHAGDSRGRPRCGAGAGGRARARRSPGRGPRHPRASRRAPTPPGRAGRGGLRAGRGRACAPSGDGLVRPGEHRAEYERPEAVAL